jgi:hypothetical protein
VIDLDEADRLARAVIAEVRRQFDDLQLAVDDETQGRVYAAAGVARMLALHNSIVLLEASGRADAAGVLARVSLEAHHVALYALIGEPGAVAALNADLSHYINVLATENADVWGKEASAGMRAEAAKKFGAPKLFPFQRLRKRLQAALNKSHTPVDLRKWYTLLYRGESTYSVHGVGQLQRYFDHDTNAIVLDSPPIATSYSATVTEIVGHLAWWLFRELDLPTQKLGELRDALQHVLTQSEA